MIKNKFLQMHRFCLVVGIIFLGYPVLCQKPQGFFLNGSEPRNASIPSSTDVEKPSAAPTATVSINFTDVITPVSQYIFGNNANIYMTQMVDQPVLIDRIKKLSPNVIRFPGGNLSSVYFWNALKDQPPADAPAQLPDAGGTNQNAGYWYGKNSEAWTLSVDNYYQMLQQTSSTGIITINYGYARYSTAQDPVAAAAHLAAEWVRYDNGRTLFWEIGNESNGTWQAGHRINTATNKDGQPQIITGSLYGKHFKVFADSMRKAATEKGATIYIGAQLLQEEPASWWNNTDRNWNTGVFQEAEDNPDYYIIHSYYTPFQTNSTASQILSSATTVTQTMMSYVNHSVSQAGRTAKPVALTEWNIFAEGSKQQVSFINGMHAAIVLGELIKNKYGLACRWDFANGWSNGNDHGMFSQGDEPGVPKWHMRASYFYMYYFQRYFGNQMVAAAVSGNPDVLAYASTFSSGQAGVVIINKSSSAQTVAIQLQNFGYGERFYWHSLRGGTDNGEFSLKVVINDQGPTLPSGGRSDFENIKANSSLIAGGITVTSPARSVQYVLIENGNNIITGTEYAEQDKIKLHPNPANGTFKIDFPSAGFFKIEIVNAGGQKVYDRSLNASRTSHEVKAKLSAGTYIIRLYKQEKVINKRLVID
jgi:hypothetical protein